jgi:hypothetical protein
VLGHGSIAMTERHGTIGDDLVEREARRLAEYRVREMSLEAEAKNGANAHRDS